MTDKNVVRGGLYKHSTKGGKCVASCTACVYEEGRNDERERCLEIARGFSSCEGIAQKIAKEIMEAQDGE